MSCHVALERSPIRSNREGDFGDSQNLVRLRFSAYQMQEDSMAAPYSQDLRERVAGLIASGRSARSTAAIFSISESTAIRWAQRIRAEGHARARAMGGDRRSRLKEHRQEVLTLLAEQPDMTVAELRSTLGEKHGITVSSSTICRFFAVHKITFKKKPARRRATTS